MRTLSTLVITGLGCLLIAARAPAPDAGRSLDRCAASGRCTLTGRVSVGHADDVRITDIEGDAGRCVSVSLPTERVEQLRASGPRTMTIRGRFYGQVSDPTTAQIDGRLITVGCGDFFLFAS